MATTVSIAKVNQMRSVQVWSASPTPLTPDLTVDHDSVVRMVGAALEDRIEGLFLAGTCGEGPWLPDRERVKLIRAVAATSKGRLKLAVQATDNSVPRILDNIQRAAEAGADYAIIAAPPTFMNARPERVAGLFIDAAAASPIPVGIYDLGQHRQVTLPEEWLSRVLLTPNVVLLKDSSGSPSRRAIALAARDAKPALQLFNGDEFKCLEYLQAGYNGCMFGGAIAVARQIHEVVRLLQEGQMEEARLAESEMARILWGLYGGKDIACWLTGLKHHLVCRGMFSTTASYLGYPLTAECREFGKAHARQLAERTKTPAAVG